MKHTRKRAVILLFLLAGMLCLPAANGRAREWAGVSELAVSSEATCTDGMELGLGIGKGSGSEGTKKIDVTIRRAQGSPSQSPIVVAQTIALAPVSDDHFSDVGFATLNWPQPLAVGTTLWLVTSGEDVYVTVQDCVLAQAIASPATIARFERSDRSLELVPHRVAYVYDSDITSRDSFKTALTQRGFNVTLVSLENVATFDFTRVNAIIIGDDTGLLNTWSTPELVYKIQDSLKPIVGVGEGGYAFFGKLAYNSTENLSIGYPHGAHGDAQSLRATDPRPAVFGVPNSLPVGRDARLELYSQPVNMVEIYVPIAPQEAVALLGRSTTRAEYFPLIAQSINQYQCAVLWGFSGPPAAMTAAGLDLFENILSTSACPSVLPYDPWSDEIRATLEITGHVQIGDLNVGLGISHPDPRELQVRLTSPSGTTVTLVDRIEEPDTSLGQLGNCSSTWPIQYTSQMGQQRVFDDESSQPFPSSTTLVRPQGAGKLSDFDNQLATGTWTLTVRDNNVLANDGDLECWNLEIKTIAPTIAGQPPSTTISPGQQATLQVQAQGSGPFDYQWYRGNSGDTSSPITGATGSSYTTPALTSTSSYWVRVTNSAGSVDSATVTVTVSAGALPRRTFVPTAAV